MSYSRSLILDLSWPMATAALTLAIVFGLTIVVTRSAQAQTFNVLHSFTGGGDGAAPGAGLTMDRGGNFYGTTENGGMDGPNGYGTIFKLTHTNSGWTLTPLYSFAGGDDGASAGARVIIGPDGTLYGTTSYGGGLGCDGTGCGTVFNLRPPMNAPVNVLTDWTETVLYRFTGGSDGSRPVGDLVFDEAGDIYGATAGGGSSQNGIVYELTLSNGNWTESVLWSFTGGNDGGKPAGGVTFDSAGNLYGSTQVGGAYGYGSVFQFAPAGSGWSENTLYSFQNENDGANPDGGLIFDPSGNLYGTTASNGSGGGGTVFELTPQRNGTWALTVLFALAGQPGGGPQAGLTMDAAGNLYGTTHKDGAYGYGSVIKLTPSNGGWTYIDVHDFTSGSDGAEPVSNVILDANGNLYGTALAAGGYGYGVIFEIAPLLITTTSLPAGTVNIPYSASLTATGGLPPYTWSVISGSLPAGLTLNANSGVISGTPTAAGTSNFTVQVTDSESPPANASAPLSITVTVTPTFSIAASPSSLGVVQGNQGISTITTTISNGFNSAIALSASGVPSGTAVGFNPNPIPAPGSGNSTMTITVGSSTQTGTYPITVTGNGGGVQQNATVNLTVTALVALSWNASSSQDVIGYNAYRSTTSGGPYTKLNASLISGTSYNDQPLQSGYTYYYVTTAVNSQGQESVYSNQAVATVP
jgi:uncharacterized repeat protein (TIGR03803 family)